MLVYADADDLTTWLGEPAPDNAASLLRHASSRVANACRCDIYDTQPNGLPVDDDIREALMEATCAQAERWKELNVNPAAGAGGLAVQVTSSSIDGSSVSTTAATVDAARAEALEGLCELSVSILRNAGLASSLVRSS
ncbi:hypothetical protein EU244_012830 [Rhodococcus qingshengii]|uniref:hypothetical protein n=1 Tax=Rhodococcus qingshengii TaxID=334542 RepID=UPI0010A67A08|nr:hypothetical protein [Rhodococcus qingshengii]THJ69983.1 hypothetical protein EU244_20200 [Rhodococcus qingshengii]